MTLTLIVIAALCLVCGAILGIAIAEEMATRKEDAEFWKKYCENWRDGC